LSLIENLGGTTDATIDRCERKNPQWRESEASPNWKSNFCVRSKRNREKDTFNCAAAATNSKQRLCYCQGTATSHWLLDGCSTNKKLLPAIYGDPRLVTDSVAAGFVVCCAADGSSASRKLSSNNQCYSGTASSSGGGTLVTYTDAVGLCTSEGLRLCASQSEVDLSCGNGCQYDNALVWTSQAQACIDIQPPATWGNPTCASQLANTNICEKRRNGEIDDGYCSKTCGVCSACVDNEAPMVSWADPTCADQVAAGKCSESWHTGPNGYCRKSCGHCTQEATVPAGSSRQLRSLSNNDTSRRDHDDGLSWASHVHVVMV